MSAYVVDDKVIHALLTWAQRPQWSAPACYYHPGYRLEDKHTFYDNLDMIGQILVNQNYRSVNHRYNDMEIPPEYHWERYPLSKLSAVQVIKACDCYAYQACEVDDWETTEAHKIIDTIRERAIDELPGMEEAEWGVP